MKQIDVDPYDPLMSDAEFYKLMGIEDAIDPEQQTLLESGEPLPQAKTEIPKHAALKTWLPVVAATAMLVALVFV